MANKSNISIGVVGMGLIGASILKDVQKHTPTIERYGVSTGREQQIAIQERLINPKHNLKYIVNNVDLIVIATPIAHIVSIAKEIAKLHSSKQKLIVIDVASVKMPVYGEFEKLNKQNKNITFITTHPMGGSEKNGFNSAKCGLFRNKPWLICKPHKLLHKKTIEIINLIIKDSCGANIYNIDTPEQHDKLIATTSLFVLNISNILFDFVSSVHPESLQTAGESVITTTRLAGDNPTMLADINKYNKEPIQQITTQFIKFLQSQTNNTFDKQYFQKNKQARDSWLHYRNKNK